MKLLVTGGAGFIGSNFIRHILNKYPNYRIINLDVLTYAGNLDNLEDIEKNPRYRFVKGDICDANLVNELIADVEAIVNFAAETHVDRSILEPHSFIKTNVLGTQILLEAARKHQKRFHQISTDEVYGSLEPNDPPFNENTSYNPRSPYSASKAAADQLVLAYFHTYRLPVTISNCSNNYGPYQFPEKFIPFFATNLLEDKEVPLYGDGMNIRDWLYAKDHCRAIDLILHRGKIGETYCIGGNCEKTNWEVAKMIARIIGQKESMIKLVKDRPGHDRRYAMDTAKIQQELGWRPETNFEEGLNDTLAWYKNNPTWWRRVKSGEYQKYYQQQYG